ncbi:hypothetical protein [Flavivirga eckloniae]|uniref:Lipoprotein n=1 Tax=Flavivirga eckloniae TaxID=1803846 RepID=A0A2K9PK87_9FLAO|nr:hypothetical protein [Flavivirga eckloniae]AUP77452.1 hypothetical protein C1H87_01435 [Flavivirga eckloniae]
MKYFLRTLFFIALFLGVLQSCSSGETSTETISAADKISPDLLDSIIFTASYVSDYNLINFECQDNVTIISYFLNSQGDYSLGPTIKIPFWSDESMSTSLKQIYADTGVIFTKDDFRIMYVAALGSNNNPGPGLINSRKNFIDFFEDCRFDGDIKFFPEYEPAAKVSDINYNCLGSARYYIEGLDNSFIADNIPLSSGVSAVMQALQTYNEAKNTQYTIDQLRINQVDFISPGQTESRALGGEQIINYSENCALDRPKEMNDCINFKYPFVFNRINLQTEEIIPITVTSDKDLIQNLKKGGNENLTITYPITLETLNGDDVIVTSNDELKNALDNSSFYCTDEW